MARSEGGNGKVLDNISFNDGFDMMNRTDDGVSLHMDSDLPAAFICGPDRYYNPVNPAADPS